MSSLNRRQFLQSLGLASAATAAIAFPGIITAATTRPHVVVIGGGLCGCYGCKIFALLVKRRGCDVG